MAVEEEGEPWREHVDVEPAIHRILDVGEAVREGERELLDGRRAGLPDVIPRDRDGVEPRCLLGGELDHVRDELQRRTGRDDPLLLRDELLEHVVLEGSPEFLARDAPSIREGDVHGVDDWRAGVDGEGRGDLGQIDPVEQDLEVREGVDRHPLLPDLAERHRIVGVDPHQRRHVERSRESSLPLVDQVAKALVRLFRRSVACELPHRPQPAAVHRRVDAPRERRLAGEPEVVDVIEAVEVPRPVQAVDLPPRDGREPVRALVPVVALSITPRLASVPDLPEVVGVEHVRQLCTSRP